MAITAAQLDVRFTSSGAGQVKGELRSLEDSFKSASSGFDSLTEAVQKAPQAVAQVGQAFTAFGAGVTGVIAGTVSRFASLEAAMANVGTITGQTSSELEATTDQIRSLSVEMGAVPEDLAQALYNITSAGIPAADAMGVLEASTTAAAAGLTDTSTAADAIVSVLNAYGREAEDAADVSDVLFQTVKSGNLNFQELSTNMGRVLPVASSLGVEIEELGAAYAELTLQGMNAEAVQTSMTALLSASLQETDALSEAVQEYGYASAEALIQAEGLVGFLDLLIEKSAGSGAALTELLGSQEAVRAAMILTRNDGQGYINMLADMENAQGATAAAFERQMATISASFGRLRASLTNLSIEIGSAFAPFVGAGIDTASFAINELTSAIGALPGPLQTAAAGLTGLAGGASLLAGGFMLLLPRIVETRAAIQTLGGMRGIFGMLARSISPVGLAITAVVAAGGFLVHSFLEQRAAAESYKDSIVDLETALEMLRRAGDTALADLGEGLMNTVDQLDARMDDFLDAMRPDQMQFEMDRFLEEFGRLPEGAAELQQARTMYEAEFQLIKSAFDETVADMAISAEDMTAINLKLLDALQDPDINVDAWIEWAQGLLTAADNAEELRAAVDTIIETPLSEWSRNAADSMASLAGAAETTFGALNTGASEYNAGLEEIAAAQEEAVADITEMINELLEQKNAWIEASRAIGGFDDALSTLNLAGMAGNAGLFAESMIATGEALDNTFRIIVGNTNALGGQIQAVEDWALELINVAGEYGKIDDLLGEGLITLEQYNAAQQAQAEISHANAIVQQDILKIQAMQAPIIAEATVRQAEYIHGLSTMTAEQQRVRLAFMDTNTVAAAQEIVMQGASAAMGKWGAEGRTAFEAMIHGAAQSNPMLLEVLDTMGIIDQTEVGFDINWDALADGGNAIELLTTNVGHLVDTLREIHGLPPIEVTANAAGVEEAAATVDFLYERVIAADGTEAFVIIRVDETGAESIDQIVSSVDNLDGTYTVQVEATTGATYEAVLAYDGEVISTTFVDVQARIQGGAGVGDGTGGAQNWKELLNVPDAVDVPVTVTGDEAVQGVVDAITSLPESTPTDVAVNVTGNDEITTLSEQIAGLQDTTVTITVNADTSGLAGLGSLGIYAGGNESGGAAAIESPTVTVMFKADTSDIDNWTPPEISPIPVGIEVDASSIGDVFEMIRSLEGAATVEVAITGNAGGPDGALSVISSVLAGDKSPRSVEIAVTADAADANAAISDLVLSLAVLATNAPNVTITADDQASGHIGEVQGTLDALNGDNAHITVTGEDQASGHIGEVQGTLDALNGDNAHITITGDGSDAMSAISVANQALAGLDGDNAHVTITATDYASSVIGGVLNMLNSIPGSRSTTLYANTVNTTTFRQVGSPNNRLSAYAEGGYVRTPFQLVGEEGPELVQLPMGSYVHTADETERMLANRREDYGAGSTRTAAQPHREQDGGGGDTYEMHIHGNVYGIDELTDSLAAAVQQRRRSYGGMRA